ncbi:MAG: hypothetical protein VZQ75_02650 [Candidatus Faecousia sp.]|nr:hypothetical protein [Candidatus Faecousia sp.]
MSSHTLHGQIESVGEIRCQAFLYGRDSGADCISSLSRVAHGSIVPVQSPA